MSRFQASTIATLFRTELRMVLRDRRIIITSIVLPVLVMPIFLFGSSWSVKKREQKLEQAACQYAVTGSQSNLVRTLITASRQRLADEKPPAKEPFKFEEVTCTNAYAALNQGAVQLVIEGLTAGEARQQDREVKAKKKSTSPAPSTARKKVERATDDSPPGNTPVVRLVFRGDRDDSVSGLQRLQRVLQATRGAQRTARLESRGFPLAPEKVAAITEVNVASQGQVAGLALGRTITLLVLLFILGGGAVVATDSLAGEKERGTLETLLTTSARRIEIIAAKHLVILAVALIITLIQVTNLLVYVGFKLIPVPEHFAAAVPPLTAVLLIFLFLPVAALAASVLLLMSGWAKSYKEAQLYFFPVFLLSLAPALAPFLPGLPLRSAIALVPVANIAVAAKEILIGAFDWPMILLSWLVTAAAAAWTTRLSVRFLSAEKLITVMDRDSIDYAGGPALFERRVLGWFGLLWGALLIVNNYTATADLRIQLLINLVGLFWGTSWLLIYRYRLSPRLALALRLPRLGAWLAVPLAVPGGMLTGIGLFHLANYIIPVPPQMIEGFGQSLMPEDISLVQLLFFMAVLPGIFEELAFRGLLLHGLRRRLHPAVLALVVGLIFGLFHVALFRLVPTACLGIMFAAATLLTGSIFPAMVWHAANNAIGILAARHEFSLAELDPQFYMAGAILLAVAFWILWRHRTAYPGLRPWHQSELHRQPISGQN